MAERQATESNNTSADLVVCFVNTGLQPQEKQQDLQWAIKQQHLSPETTTSHHKTLDHEIQQWRKDQLQLMGPSIEYGLWITDTITNEVTEAEDQVLFLPSDVHLEQHQ